MKKAGRFALWLISTIVAFILAIVIIIASWFVPRLAKYYFILKSKCLFPYLVISSQIVANTYFMRLAEFQEKGKVHISSYIVSNYALQK